ncbi:MAG TPA: hypothetical protein VI279_04470 [Rhodocyclaceae bacterium]
MHLTVVAPGLLWPLPALRDTVFDLRLPALETLLGQGRRTPHAGLDEAAWWRQQFGLPAPLSAAALRRLALQHAADDAYWLCADPVAFRIDQQGVSLADPRQLSLNSAEAASLHADLAPLLAEAGTLYLDGERHWHLRMHEGSALPLGLPEFIDDIIGLPARALLPEGDAGKPWRRWLNEVQMTLHAHPVNAAREAAGQATVASLALWGGGRLPAVQASAFDRVQAADPVFAGLARHGGLDAETPQRPLRRFEAAIAPSQFRDALAWREALEILERDVLAPALADLKAGRLQRFTLLAFGDGGGLELELTRTGRWAFWRGPKPLTELTL